MSRKFQQAPQPPTHQKIMEDPRIVEDLGDYSPPGSSTMRVTSTQIRATAGSLPQWSSGGRYFHSWHTVLECAGSTTKPEPTAEPDPPLRGSCRLQPWP